MKIVPTPRFKNELRYIVNFIKLDSSFYAKEFLNDICRRKNKMSIWKNKMSIKIAILSFRKT